MNDFKKIFYDFYVDKELLFYTRVLLEKKTLFYYAGIKRTLNTIEISTSKNVNDPYFEIDAKLVTDFSSLLAMTVILFI